ncbi:hypothetical protein IMCC3317_21850 [Kordia antarctica]|uniref:Uncharacterized protein n=1 Tax=Kordia antarctica TaxID=1218801 RepID=A0A7L4ZJM0_9FLAO|nr:hypothetical protein [Kordia antarctica]QHI36815.1 hypothetical protein IMCC3317_21850 [Kordia antarctica]
MKKLYIIVFALLLAVPVLAQEEAPKDASDEDVYVWCVMPSKKGQWLRLTPPQPAVVADFQDKLVYLKILNPNDITEKGKLDRATSDAILKMESIKGVSYQSKELVGFTQGMKNRLLIMYHTAKRAADLKEKQ